MGVLAKGSRFWIVTGAASLSGTLAALLTSLAPENTVRRALHISQEEIQIFISISFLGAVGSSLLGFFAMSFCGIEKVWTIEVGGRRFPGWAHVAVCIAAYMAPWSLNLIMFLWAVD